MQDAEEDGRKRKSSDEKQVGMVHDSERSVVSWGMLLEVQNRNIDATRWHYNNVSGVGKHGLGGWYKRTLTSSSRRRRRRMSCGVNMYAAPKMTPAAKLALIPATKAQRISCLRNSLKEEGMLAVVVMVQDL